jgi:WD40 repeat protein
MTFSPNSDLLATSSYDKTVKIWKFLSEKEEEELLLFHTFNLPASATFSTFSSD